MNHIHFLGHRGAERPSDIRQARQFVMTGSGMMDNPMHPGETGHVSQVARCGAKTWSGAPCKSVPVTGRRRCRMHGGADGSGAPKGP